MNRVPRFAFRAAVAAMILCGGASRMHAQNTAPAQNSAPPAAQDSSKEAAKAPDGDQNPFAPQPAPALPPGMTNTFLWERHSLDPNWEGSSTMITLRSA